MKTPSPNDLITASRWLDINPAAEDHATFLALEAWYIWREGAGKYPEESAGTIEI